MSICQSKFDLVQKKKKKIQLDHEVNLNFEEIFRVLYKVLKMRVIQLIRNQLINANFSQKNFKKGHATVIISEKKIMFYNWSFRRSKQTYIKLTLTPL